MVWNQLKGSMYANLVGSSGEAAICKKSIANWSVNPCQLILEKLHIGPLMVNKSRV